MHSSGVNVVPAPVLSSWYSLTSIQASTASLFISSHFQDLGITCKAIFQCPFLIVLEKPSGITAAFLMMYFHSVFKEGFLGFKLSNNEGPEINFRLGMVCNLKETCSQYCPQASEVLDGSSAQVFGSFYQSNLHILLYRGLLMVDNAASVGENEH